MAVSCDLGNVIKGPPTLLPSSRCNVTRSTKTFTARVSAITRSNAVVNTGPTAHAVVTAANGSVWGRICAAIAAVGEKPMSARRPLVVF